MAESERDDSKLRKALHEGFDRPAKRAVADEADIYRRVRRRKIRQVGGVTLVSAALLVASLSTFKLLDSPRLRTRRKTFDRGRSDNLRRSCARGSRAC